MLRDAGCAKKTLQRRKRRAHRRPGFNVLPPMAAVGFPVVLLSLRFDVLTHILEGRFVMHGVCFRRANAVVNNPCALWPLGKVHAIHPRLANIRAGERMAAQGKAVQKPKVQRSAAWRAAVSAAAKARWAKAKKAGKTWRSISSARSSP